ncbi:tryptophan 2,3-dioxygenase family protein [Sediminitomix flava]|uniref:Tryptophan 2,3-dioxygenase n=1 Tax=Sediminitomix flava TaxID=379075 RepID=A0A315ZK58_SEDFL|nr:tryptophan 2,3-dioxygenase family protein [Sediminitomix flava]PWJ45074.1 tryptophan 2,3-dioxygenase [Sediminitomix flava]
MHKNRGPVYYADYLQLDKLLDAQLPLSKKYGEECHDEMLFILVHQTYELWFKQIIHEIADVQRIFSQEEIDEKEIHLAVTRLQRIQKVQEVIQGHLGVLETMTPMDFLEFRDLLVPASGFQSVQFREIEIRLGLKTDQREGVDREFFTGRLNDQDKSRIDETEKVTSVFDSMEAWLERLPFTQQKIFDFWEQYAAAVDQMLEEDHKLIVENPTLNDKMREIQLTHLEMTRSTFNALLNEENYEAWQAEGNIRLSRKALFNALFIFLYREEPVLQQPFQFLNMLIDIDEGFTSWRYRHALMAQRMLGTKIGTGGSSGHKYLKKATQNNRIFLDLFNLSTFLIPKAYLPELPHDVKKQLDFFFSRVGV